MAEPVERELLGELLDVMRLLRPRSHDREISRQHIPGLRQFIDVGAAQPPAEPGHAGIVDRGPLAGLETGPHRPELGDGEGAAAPADARLAEEQRPAVSGQISGYDEG